MTLQDPANALPRFEECRVGLVALIFTVNLFTNLFCLCFETNHSNGKLFGQTFSQENISNDPSAIKNYQGSNKQKNPQGTMDPVINVQIT